MNDRQLRSFVAVAKEGSFSAAARKCYITTSAMIQQINALEQGLGFSLFLRGFHGLELTPAGEHFLAATRRILAEYDKACIECSVLEQKKLELRFAYQFEDLPPDLLRCYQAFCKLHPNIDTKFVSASFSNQIEEIRGGSIDIGVIAEPSAGYMKGLRFVPIKEDTLSFCMSRNHPLAQLERLTPADLQGYTVECGNYPYLRTSFAEQLSAAGILCEESSSEYSFTTRMTHLVSDKLFVIHSMWSQSWAASLAVVPSALSAGRVGLLTRDAPPAAAALFIAECEQYFANAARPGTD